MSEFKKKPEEEPLELQPTGDLRHRIESLEQAFHTELTGSMSLNIRGSFLSAGSALALLLVAMFSSTWLDDSHWEFADIWDIVMQALLFGTAVAFALTVLIGIFAVWPRRNFAGALRERIEAMNTGDAAKETQLLLGMLDSLRVSNERKARWTRIASVPFVLAVLATVAQCLIFAWKAELVDPPRDGEATEVEVDDNTGLPSAEDQLALARRYAPRVWLHSRERFGPLDPSAFVGGSELQWRNRRSNRRVAGRGSVAAERLGRHCGSAPGGCYEFADVLARELTRPFSGGPQRAEGVKPRRGFALNLDNALLAGQSGRDPDVPVYYEFRRTPRELLMTYWFSYGNSTPHAGGAVGAALRDELSHEGDWENVDVALTLDASAPRGMYFYGHGSPTRRAWDELELDGDHPVVYSALDSHASYAEGGTTKVCGDLGSANDIRDQGFRWDTWTGADSLRPVKQEPWYGYGGAWGAADTAQGRTGPLGPSRWKLPADPDPGDLGSGGCH